MIISSRSEKKRKEKQKKKTKNKADSSFPKSASKDVVKSEVSKDHTNLTNYDDVFAYALVRMTPNTNITMMLNLQYLSYDFMCN